MTEYNLNPTFGDPPSEDARDAAAREAREQAGTGLPPYLGVPAPEGTDTGPSFSGTYIDPEDPESSGAPPAFTSMYMPSFYLGMIEAATFLFDIPIGAVGWALGEGAEALGWDELAKDFRRPVTVGGVVKEVFEAPARIEEAITGEPAGVLTSGFRATPREPRNAEERFWRDVFYLSGGAASFPTSLGAIFKTFGGPINKLLADASGRGANSQAARSALDAAKSVKGPSARQALVDAARQYASRYTVGLGTKWKRTLGVEQALATSAGIGFGAPEFYADNYADAAGKIMIDLGEGMGEVDIMPSIKILSSLGLPIGLAHSPSGLLLTGNKTKILPLLRWVTNKGRVFAKSLIGGWTEKGRYDLASRIFNEMESQPGFLENTFLPAVEAGEFQNPIRILPDGTVVPEYGGLLPDTLQAMRIKGLDDTRLSALDASLRGKGLNAQARLTEETRRAAVLDETFDLLRLKVRAGDEAETYSILKKIRDNLDAEALDSIDDAMARAREVYLALEPVLGRAEASSLAVEMLDGARLASREVSKKLWAKDLIGTEYVDTRSFGDWAVDVIKETSRNLRVTPGMGVFYKLAGRKRLADELGIGESGKPLTKEDLGGVKGDKADELLMPEEIAENGLYDIFGEAGTLYSQPVKIEALQNFRSQMGDSARAAYRRGDAKVGRNYSRIIDYIDDELLAAKNFEGSALPLSRTSRINVRNIEIARGYTKTAKDRFGPNSEIGRILYKGDEPLPEEFLQRLLKSGPGSGARVELFRDALNEPVQVTHLDEKGRPKVTWSRDPAATLTLSDNPNVIEADLLKRYTESVANGKVSQTSVDRFLRQYGEAVDKIEGLRGKFNDLAGLQHGVDAMTAKLTVPDRNQVFAALKAGATPEDVANARRLLLENLTDRRFANTASEYLGADVNQAASIFIKSSPKIAAQRADELAALLAKDESGAAQSGFRAALWRALRENSRRVDKDGIVQPGIDTKKLTETIEQMRPYLEKFYDPNQIEILNSLVRGAPLQQTGTGVAIPGILPGDVMGAGFAATEAVGAAGRSLGQKVFGWIGINTLVATGMGKRISGYTFGKIGAAGIFRVLEEAFRDTTKAAALVKRYKELPDWDPTPAVKQRAEDLLDDPAALARDVAGDAKSRLTRSAGFVSKYVAGHSREAIERAVRYGLIPAQAESRKLDLEEDYLLGPPFVYQDNRIRYHIEKSRSGTLEIDITGDLNNDGVVSNAEKAFMAQPSETRSAQQLKRLENAPASAGSQSSQEPPRTDPPLSASVLSKVNPVGPRPIPFGGAQPKGQALAEQQRLEWINRNQGTSQPNTAARGQEVFGEFDPIFRPGMSHGGIASIKPKKPRQMVL